MTQRFTGTQKYCIEKLTELRLKFEGIDMEIYVMATKETATKFHNSMFNITVIENVFSIHKKVLNLDSAQRGKQNNLNINAILDSIPDGLQHIEYQTY